MGGSGAVGLDIGTSAVRAAELSSGRRSPVLERFAEVGLEPGWVRDGEVINVEGVTAAIKRLWVAGRFTTKRVVVGVANQRVVVRQVDLPYLAPKEMKKSLPFQVADVIPMPVEQAVLDFYPLGEFTNEAGGRMQKLLLVAAAKDMVNTSLKAVTGAGLTPVMVDLNPFAVIRAVGSAADSSAMSQAAEALVEVGSDVTNIVVHRAGEPAFVRVLLMGGGDITDALAERMGVPFGEAEQAKKQMVLGTDPAQVDPHPASRVLEHAAMQWVDEVRGSLHYYASQADALTIDHIVLCGGGSRLRGLAGRLSQATRLPVVPGLATAGLGLGKQAAADETLAASPLHLAVSVGLALGNAS